MTEIAVISPAAGSPEATAMAIGSIAIAAQYTFAAVLIAGAQSGAIDPERVFSMLETLATGFDSGPGGDLAAGKMTALILRGVGSIYRNLTTLPADSGRA